VTKAALSELGSAPRLGVGGGIGGSETRSIAGMYNCLNTVRSALQSQKWQLIGTN